MCAGWVAAFILSVCVCRVSLIHVHRHPQGLFSSFFPFARGRARFAHPSSPFHSPRTHLILSSLAGCLRLLLFLKRITHASSSSRLCVCCLLRICCFRLTLLHVFVLYSSDHPMLSDVHFVSLSWNDGVALYSPIITKTGLLFTHHHHSTIMPCSTSSSFSLPHSRCVNRAVAFFFCRAPLRSGIGGVGG